MKKEVVAHKNPKAPISEAFRTLRTNIQFMNTKKKLKTLLVTSTFPGEGKSWITTNLAVTFAQAGKKVVLIDADMRKGRQYTIFGISPRPGLSNYLSQVEIDENEKISENVEDYIQETEVENLYVMVAGNVPPNPSELLVSPQMIKLLDELNEICDIIIIDGTPCELVTDSLILSRLVDSTLIVTAHKSTKKDALDRVIKNIQNVNGKIAGVVINKVPSSSKRYGYGQSYYYYYGSDSKRKNSKNKMYNFNKANLFIKRKPKEQTITKQEEKPENIELKVDIENNEREEISLEKTNDILNQINEYINQERQKLDNGDKGEETK